MRLVSAILIALVAVVPAAAQNEETWPSGAAQQASPGSKFRKPSPARVKARTTARKAQGNPQQAEGHSARGTAASPKATAVRKRIAPAHPNVAREPAAPRAEEGLLVQSELAWIGEYTGPINGEVDDKTAAAIKSFQRNRKFRETGVLNTQERVLLATAAKARQAQVGWTVVDDPVTGARLGLPGKQIPNKTQSKTGTRWSSAQGQVQIETFRIREPGTTLAAVFEQQKKDPAGRKIETSQLTPNSFVLSGTQGPKKFHVRADIKDGEVRGMTVLHDPVAEPIMDPVVVVMSHAFTAFPGTTGAVQAGVPPPKRKVEYGTGIVASEAGHILTDRQLTEGCDVIVVSGYGNADLLAEDRTADLALIRVYGAPDLAPAALATDGRGPNVVLVGIADPQTQGGGSAISTATAQVRGATLEPAPQIGFTGAAALDRDNRFLGMAQLRPQVIANIGNPTLQAQATVVPAQAIRAFLESRELKPATGQAGLEATKASLVRVICVRK